MLTFENPLVKLYINLIGWILTGYLLGRRLPKSTSTYLAKFLFFCGTPFSIIAFTRRANLSGAIFISPLTAWIAILVGATLAWIWIDLGVSDERMEAMIRKVEYITQKELGAPISQNLPEITTAWSKPTQGSFLLAMMVGNTGFLGIPVILSLLGPENFAWALFYDLLGSAVAVNVVGVALASYYGYTLKHSSRWTPLIAIFRNPALWAFAIGITSRQFTFSPLVENSLQMGAWAIITLSLIMIGIQLSKLSSLKNLKQGLTCLGIKMLLTPLVVGTGLMFFGITGAPRLLLVLQMGMPPAFVTTLLAETFGLDRDLAVTTIALGCLMILFTIPLWIWLFGFDVIWPTT